jgi:hypothetical protein
MTARLVLAALIAALALPASAAADGWTAPATIDRASGGFRVGDSAVAVTGRGATTVAWVRSRPGRNVLHATRIASGGATRSWVVRRSGSGLLEPAVLLAGRLSVFGWRWNDGRNLRIEARALDTRSGALGPRQRLTSGAPDASRPAFIGSAGGLRLAWLRTGSEPDLQVATPGRRGRFGSTVRYDVDGAQDFDATVASGDRLAAAYTRRLPGETSESVVVAVQGLSGLSEIASFPAGADASDPAIAADGAGRLVVAWAELVGGVSERVMVAVRERDAASFSAPVELQSGTSVRDVALVPKSDGDTLVTWLSREPGDGALLMVSTVTGGARALSLLGHSVTAYAASTDARGAAYFAYREAANGTGGALYAARINSHELLSTPRRVTPAGERASRFSLGVGARGAARITWTDAGGRAIRMARRIG